MTILSIEDKPSGGKPFIDLTGPDGNAFYVLAQVNNLGRQLGWTSEKIKQIQSEMQTGDYENLISVFDKYFGEYINLYR